MSKENVKYLKIIRPLCKYGTQCIMGAHLEVIMKITNLRKGRDSYSRIMHEVGYLSERYVFCKNNKEMAVLISWDDWKMIEKMFREIDEKRTLKE